MELLFDDSDQHVGSHGAPDLSLDRVLAGPQKALDAQVLLDPLEEQFHLPAALVERGDRQGRQRRIVGQERQRLARFRVVETDAPQMLRVVLGRVMPVETNPLVADHARGAVGLGRIHAPRIHAALGARHEERTGLMHREEPCEVQIAAIHHIEGTRFDGQNIEHIDVAHLAVADVDERRNVAAQVQQRVHLHGRLGRAKRRPVEQTQAQVDRRRVQRVDRRIDIESGRFGGIEFAGARNQAHRQRVIDAPVALIQCVRQRGARRYARQAHVKQLGLIGGQADLDVAQRFPPCQLGEGHHPKQVGAIQSAHSGVAAVSIDNTPEGLPRHILHDLCKQRPADVHRSSRVGQTRKDCRGSDQGTWGVSKAIKNELIVSRNCFTALLKFKSWTPFDLSEPAPIQALPSAGLNLTGHY